MAHEWWGNAVSAEHWGHFWVHEGFGTYAEGVYVEMTRGREEADRFFAGTNRRIPTDSGSLYRGDHPESGNAYTGLIYSKGSAVLNTLRHYIDDDEAWWKSLKGFNLEYRYGNASTEDFQAVLEKETGKEWGQFFQEWFYGTGTPQLEVEIGISGKTIELDVDNTHGEFHVPLDVSWYEGSKRKEKRLWVDPGQHSLVIETAKKPKDPSIDHLDRLLGKHSFEVK